MRNRYLIGLFLIIVVAVNAQNEAQHIFPASNAYWSETTWYEVICNGTYTTGTRDFNYYLSGDTVLNNKTYHKLRVEGGNEWTACEKEKSFSSHKYDSAVGYIRDDANKVYFTYPAKGIYDTLLYDFNLRVGDTLPDTYTNQRAQKNVVQSIDKIQIGKKYHKIYNISKAGNSKPYTELIEGIGCTCGLLEPIVVPFEAGGRLNCFKQNGVTEYPSVNDSCSLFNGNENTESLKVYCSSAGNMLTITYSLPKGESKGIFKLYNIRGELLQMKEVTNGASPVIELVNTMSSGVYYATLSVNDNVITSSKLVVALK